MTKNNNIDTGFNLGDIVDSKTYGQGTVVYVGKKIFLIIVDFDSGISASFINDNHGLVKTGKSAQGNFRVRDMLIRGAQEEIETLFMSYNFRDEHGHPLSMCTDFIALLDYALKSSRVDPC
jgi:hypothetical protein